MAGVKGRSGGPRANSGGARPGAGRKKKEVEPLDVPERGDPKDFLLDVMNDPGAEPRARLDAAKALMPYMHPKLGEGGKKDQKAEAAKKVGAGKFAASAPPKLRANVH
jgi:phage terminase small subunit